MRKWEVEKICVNLRPIFLFFSNFRILPRRSSKSEDGSEIRIQISASHKNKFLAPWRLDEKKISKDSICKIKNHE